MDVQHNSAYLFDCRKHMDSWVGICVLKVCIDHIRIDLSCCIVIVITREGPSDIVLIVTASHICFRAFGA